MFSSICRKNGDLVRIGVRDSVQEVCTQIKERNEGGRTDLFSNLKDDVQDGRGDVVLSNKSRIVIKLHDQVDAYAIKMLKAQEDVFEVGDEVSWD